METILIYLIIGILLAIIFTHKMYKNYQKLDNDSKLKQIEINSSVRKIYLVSLLIIMSFFYLVVRLDLFDIYIPLMISLLILFVILLIIANRKSEIAGITKQHSKKSIIIKITFITFYCIALFFYYRQMTTEEKTSYDFQIEAQEQTRIKKWENAIILYSKSIELDSLNANCYYNRGCCKYYTNDTVGACKDWNKANELGDKTALYNLTSFCK